MPVLVVALDGATFDLLSPWLAEGALPTLSKLMASGTSGELRSTLPPLTAPAWASFMTGKNPGKHGIFDFFQPHAADLDQHKMVNSSHIRAKLLWEYLSEANVAVGVLNVPLTHPPRPVKGYLVPGLLSPDQGQTCYPPHLLRRYHDALGPYRLTPDLLYDPRNTAAFIADLHALCETQSRYAERLFTDHPTDFFMVHFLAPDIAQHKLWHFSDPAHPWHAPVQAAQYGSALRDLYVRLDRAIADLIALMPAGTTVVVMSDHGFGPRCQTVNLNQFFIERGLMRLRRDWRVHTRQWLFNKPRLWHWLGRWLRPLSFADVDWTRTVAYSLGHVGQVYLNVKGRQPFGVVRPDRYQVVRSEVMAELCDLRHPVTGQPLVEQVVVREASAHGPYLDNGPDLHLVMDGYRTMAYPMFAASGDTVTQQRWGNSGDHRPNGILIAAGPPIKAGHTFSTARLVDLAPTLLYLMGVPVPVGMDGEVLRAGITEAYQAEHPVHHQSAVAAVKPSSTLIESEEDVVVRRLRELGYMEGT
jgi:predicted AlkP superfamily phosphohydrolase/phosphomutase